MLSPSDSKECTSRHRSLIVSDVQYYTDYVYAPVRSIAEASTTGHGTNIITGVAVGMKSTVIPCVTVSAAVIAAYHLGRTSGVGDGHSAGIFGTAVATMGMLSSAVYVLSMNNFGEIFVWVYGGWWVFSLGVVGRVSTWLDPFGMKK